MDLHDVLFTDFPAPRDDEQGGLRDDILDELADHLACSYRRELMRGADTATARQRVLERFGDPAALARRLWFDAKKAKIMAMSKSVNSPRSPDWIPVSFELTQDTPDGPAAVGVQASLGRGNQGSAIQRVSDDKGAIDFGVVQPGDWEFTL